ANGVAIFDSIEPANGDLTRIGVFWIDLKNGRLDPLSDLVDLLRTGPRFVLGRHDPRPEHLHSSPPKVSVFKNGFIRRELIQRHTAAFRSLAVAFVAESSQNRFNGLVKLDRTF